MGVRKKSEVNWTEEKIQNMLRHHFLSSSTKKYELIGRFLYDWESDYIAITKSGYVYECEIKVTRKDFNDDRKKVEKYLILEDKSNTRKPNYFYYAVPEGLIQPDEVPEGYGLLYVSSYRVDVIKKASLIHSEKADYDSLNLIDKFYYGMWNYIDRYRQIDVDALKNRIRKLEKEIKSYDDLLSKANSKISTLEYKINKLDRLCRYDDDY